MWSLPGDDLGGLLSTPDRVRNRYLAAADVGGRSAESNPSCTAILDRAPRLIGGLPSIAAEWHGHDDVDRYAWASV